MRLQVYLCACVALMVSVEGQRRGNPDEVRLGLVATTLNVDPVPGADQGGNSGKEGREVCFCQPLNQRCITQITSTRQGPSSTTLEVDKRIVNRPTLGVCPGEKKCCYIDNTMRPITETPPFRGCGVQNPQPYRQAGNAEATFGEYPWMAILLSFANDYKGGGVLIAEDWVLTAAHKVYQERSLKVRLGDLDVTKSKDHPRFDHVEVNVAQIFVHPNFDAVSLKNDVALLKLQQSVGTRQYPHIGTACLPEQNQLFDAERKCWVTGYGKDAFTGGQFQTILKEVDVPIVDHARCQDRLRETKLGRSFNLDRISFLCAGGILGKDACTGDGGAPLVCNDGRGWTVVGLVAWGIGCAEEVPGVYVNIPNFRNYIREVTGI